MTTSQYKRPEPTFGVTLDEERGLSEGIWIVSVTETPDRSKTLYKCLASLQVLRFLEASISSPEPVVFVYAWNILVGAEKVHIYEILDVGEERHFKKSDYDSLFVFHMIASNFLI